MAGLHGRTLCPASLFVGQILPMGDHEGHLNHPRTYGLLEPRVRLMHIGRDISGPNGYINVQ